MNAELLMLPPTLPPIHSSFLEKKGPIINVAFGHSHLGRVERSPFVSRGPERNVTVRGSCMGPCLELDIDDSSRQRLPSPMKR